MIRVFDGVLIAAAIGGAVWTYQIKHEADLSAKRIKGVQAQIAAQNRKIALLEADWAIDTNPARLEKLAKKYEAQLGLRPMESTQIIDLTELPGFRADRHAPGEEVYAGKDGETVTGGIGALIERENEQ